MNDFDRGFILGAANNIKVTRTLTEHYVRSGYLMRMGCIVRDENEEEVSNVSLMYTSNMIKLRALTWYLTSAVTNYTSNGSFVSTSGNVFTGYYGMASSNSGAYGSYSASVLAYAPQVYISADKTELSRNDYALCDDATAISWSTAEQSTVDGDGVSMVLHIYYSNGTDEDVTINKIQITGLVLSTKNSDTYSSALLFEELLDDTITIKSGEQWARDYVFKLDC